MTICEQIKARMKERRITITEIGRRLGISRQNVCQKLNGRCQLLSSTLAMAECIGLECMILEKNGAARVPCSQALIATAKDEKVPTMAFEKMVEAIGWEIYLDWV